MEFWGRCERKLERGSSIRILRRILFVGENHRGEMNDKTSDMTWFCLKGQRNMGDTEDGVIFA